MDKKSFEELLQSIKEAAEIIKGKKEPSRKFEIKITKDKKEK